MSEEVWSLLETRDGGLHGTAFKMAAEARRTARIFGGSACGLLLGPDPERHLPALGPCGLDKVYICPTSQGSSAETYASFLAAAAREYKPRFVLLAHTPAGAEAAARLAVGLRCGLISECTDFQKSGDECLARKPVYNGRADALMTWREPPYLATLKLSALEDAQAGPASSPEVVPLNLELPPEELEFVRRWQVDLSELEITEAGVVVGVGKGVSEKIMAQVQHLAELAGAALGGTRIAVHTGLIPVSRQIGTTGKWLASDLYLALGISGAPQHVMGIKGVESILAVNTSHDAPIFKYAKLGVVGDVADIVPRLIDLLKGRRQNQ